MTAQDFIAKWSQVDLTERQASQPHFLDLCELVGHPAKAGFILKHQAQGLVRVSSRHRGHFGLEFF
jgi:hypothetical protein